jgi:prepilin-type processing-associated H-X9-DG protein
VFHNLHRYPTRTVSLDYLSTHDGSTNTVLLSENVQATQWADPNGSLRTPWQAETCILWWRWSDYAGNPFTPAVYPPTTAAAQAVVTINRGRDDLGTIPVGGYEPPNPATQNVNLFDDNHAFTNGWIDPTALPTGATDETDFLAYGRPSSRHPGGAIMTFCDGHNQFISDSLDYGVYQQIMTPYGRTFSQGLFDASILAP